LAKITMMIIIYTTPIKITTITFNYIIPYFATIAVILPGFD